jgi:Mn2+/Fe2+ NRAMP family transporter
MYGGMRVRLIRSGILTARATSLVIDSGARATTVCAVHDGYVLKKCMDWELDEEDAFVCLCFLYLPEDFSGIVSLLCLAFFFQSMFCFVIVIHGFSLFFIIIFYLLFTFSPFVFNDSWRLSLGRYLVFFRR